MKYNDILVGSLVRIREEADLDMIGIPADDADRLRGMDGTVASFSEEVVVVRFEMESGSAEWAFPIADLVEAEPADYADAPDEPPPVVPPAPVPAPIPAPAAPIPLPPASAKRPAARPTVTGEDVEMMVALGVDVLLLVPVKTKGGELPGYEEYTSRIAPVLAALKSEKWDKIATFINDGV